MMKERLMIKERSFIIIIQFSLSGSSAPLSFCILQATQPCYTFACLIFTQAANHRQANTSLQSRLHHNPLSPPVTKFLINFLLVA
jgi:hypothetical protein